MVKAVSGSRAARMSVVLASDIYHLPISPEFSLFLCESNNEEKDMTEAEALELTVMCVDNAITCFSVYVTMTFAYLTASYLMGSSLSTFQALVLSGLYVFSSGGMIVCMYLHIRTWSELRAGVPGGIAAMDNISLWNEAFWAYYPASSCLAGILISLFFMWNVRHPKTE